MDPLRAIVGGGSPRLRRYLGWTGALVLALLGAAVIAFATDPLPWANSDSVEYVVSARNLIGGKGLGLVLASGRFAPLTHVPPFYPLLLSAGGVVGVDPLVAARWLDVALFPIFLLLVAAFALRYLGSPLLAWSLLAIAIVTPDFVRLFAGALSEPAFLCLVLGSTFLSIEHARSGRPWLAGGAALLAALAILTRFAGFPIAVSGAAILILLSAGPVLLRVLKGLLFSVACLAPTLAWMIFLRAAYNAEPPRTSNLSLSDLWVRVEPFRRAMVESLWSFLPLLKDATGLGYRTRLATLGVGVVVIGVALGVGLLWRRRTPTWALGGSVSGLAGVGVFSACYVVGLVMANGVTEPVSGADFRLLSPVFIPTWILILGLFHLVGSLDIRLRIVEAVPILIAFLMIGVAAPAARELWARLHSEGEGYTSAAWRASSLVEEVRSLPPDLPVISNETAALLLLADRPAYDIPELINQERHAVHATFGSDLEDPIERKFRSQGAALVMFNSVRYQLETVYGTAAEDRWRSMVAGLSIWANVWDGVVYFYPRGEN